MPGRMALGSVQQKGISMEARLNHTLTGHWKGENPGICMVCIVSLKSLCISDAGLTGINQPGT